MHRVISSASSTRIEIQRDAGLAQLLHSRGQFPADSDRKTRCTALASLFDILTDFVEAKADIHLQLYTFGSFRLGVYDPSSDVDLVVVTNRGFTLETVFHELHHFLKRRACTQVVSVTQAFVPVLSFRYMAVSFDLLWCQTNTNCIPCNLLWDEAVVRGLSPPQGRSLNGIRVTETIQRMAPNRPEDFRLALRFVRCWAKARGLYGNVFGFPGGVAWAILLTKVCLWFPRACASALVRKFFRLWSGWDFRRPVTLGTTSWSAGHKRNAMVVLTPCYPTTNATYNVDEPQMRRLRREFGRADELGWDFPRIARPACFLRAYKHYVVVYTPCPLPTFHGFMESKLRHFLVSLNSHWSVQSADIWPAYLDEGFHIGLKLNGIANGVVDLSSCVRQFRQLLEVSRPEGTQAQAVVVEYRSREECAAYKGSPSTSTRSRAVRGTELSRKAPAPSPLTAATPTSEAAKASVSAGPL